MVPSRDFGGKHTTCLELLQNGLELNRKVLDSHEMSAILTYMCLWYLHSVMLS